MNVTVLRYDPTTDPAPHYEDYEVPWKEKMTVLEALVYIHENLDPIALDYSCRGRVCGRCAMMMDGEPIMACYTSIPQDGSIVVEPLKGFPVIRDLVVDKSKVHDRLFDIYNRVRYAPLTKEEILEPVNMDDNAIVTATEWCARCLSCMASCSVLNMPGGGGDYLGPAGFVALGQRYFDPYDQGDRVLEAVQNGIAKCIHCGKCDEVCPADEIDHEGIYAALIAAAKERGMIEEK